MGAHRRATEACRRLTVNSLLSPFDATDARKWIFRDSRFKVKPAHFSPVLTQTRPRLGGACGRAGTQRASRWAALRLRQAVLGQWGRLRVQRVWLHGEVDRPRPGGNGFFTVTMTRWVTAYRRHGAFKSSVNRGKTADHVEVSLTTFKDGSAGL
jgi:hypothetical protein